MTSGFLRESDANDRRLATEAKASAEMQQIVQQANEQAKSLSEAEKNAAIADLHARAGNAWLERKKGERDSDNIVSIQAAIALFANAGQEVISVRTAHKHFGYLNGFVYYITIEGSPRPFVVRCDTGAVYDRGDFDQKFPPSLANL